MTNSSKLTTRSSCFYPSAVTGGSTFHGGAISMGVTQHQQHNGFFNQQHQQQQAPPLQHYNNDAYYPNNKSNNSNNNSTCVAAHHHFLSLNGNSVAAGYNNMNEQQWTSHFQPQSPLSNKYRQSQSHYLSQQPPPGPQPHTTIFTPSSPIPISKTIENQDPWIAKSSTSPNYDMWGTNALWSEPGSPAKSLWSEPSSPWHKRSSSQGSDSDLSPRDQSFAAFGFPKNNSTTNSGFAGAINQQHGSQQSLFDHDIEYVTSPKRFVDRQRKVVQQSHLHQHLQQQSAVYNNQPQFVAAAAGSFYPHHPQHQAPLHYPQNHYHQQQYQHQQLQYSYIAPQSPLSSSTNNHSQSNSNWFDQVQSSHQQTIQAGPAQHGYYYNNSNNTSNASRGVQHSPTRNGATAAKTIRGNKVGRSLNFNAIDINDPQPPQQGSPSSTETNQCRLLYKDFSKEMKQILEETDGSEQEVFNALKKFVDDNIEQRLPNTIWWRVYLFLAEHAKRHNFISEARSYYKKVNMLQPSASQGWLEHAKLEEECGNLQRCKKLINCGLQYCQTNESLLIKGIKQYAEQLNDMNGARALLSRLRGVPLEKCWKIMLEGALLESRVGNVHIARKVFKYLMQNVSRHGPVYYEAYKLEERMEQYDRALSIVEQGLSANPRYGPLWFAALRLYEKLALIASDGNTSELDLTKVRDCIQRAVDNISKELVWKVWFESAQIEERAGHLDLARKSYTKSVMTCMTNLRWKVWLAGSRTELNFNNMQTSRLLLNRALTEVPTKTKAVVLIECARLEEYSGNIDKAREFLQRAQKEAKHEWKVFLESILLEMRAGETKLAIREAENALEIHRSTGRLWAVLIQLKQCEGEEEQLRVFKQALNEVPKSGEVWCEGARIRLNPLSPRFDLQKARQYLEFAIKFTPQYGDSFIEYLRLELLSKGPRMGKHHYSIDGNLDAEEEEGNIHIEQLCVNADPNYGPLWFHCKAHALDSSRQVLVRAKDLLMAELLRYRNIYQKAIMREYNPKDIVEDSDESDAESYNSSSSDDDAEDDDCVTSEHFTTGLYALQRLYNKSHTIRDDELRKKYIFGSESPGGLVL